MNKKFLIRCLCAVVVFLGWFSFPQVPSRAQSPTLNPSVTTAANASGRPNIILLNMDDADARLFEMPNASYLFPQMMTLARSGVTYRNFHVTTPLCGPSRACLYRGQYAHNTNIRVNSSKGVASNNFRGGLKHYREQGFFQDDVSVWMQNAGYRTMLVGKFLHDDFEAIVPQGWDDFYSYQGGAYFETHRFRNVNGDRRGVFDRTPPGVYRAAAETADAVTLLEEHRARNNDQPFFLNINPYGPHRQSNNSSSMIESRFQNWWPNVQQPFSLAYDEFDFSDKRGYFRDLPRLTTGTHVYAYSHFRERVLATRSVDDMVGMLRQTLDHLGWGQNTYIFITSDNGFSLGHHRSVGKGTPTDRSTRVPMLVSGPGMTAGAVSNQLLGHIDLAPTFVELAGGQTPGFVDGRSFASSLGEANGGSPGATRSVLLIENWQNQAEFGIRTEAAGNTVRFLDSVYTEWANGDRDYYDLLSDPEQLNNTYDFLANVDRTFLAATLRTLKNPTAPPSVRFSVPFSAQQVISQTSWPRGLAEDPFGVRQVRLAIRDGATNQFWNGTEWSPQFAQVTAELENPDGQISAWSYRQLPGGINVPTGEVTVWAWAIDANSRFAAPTIARFRFDRTGPDFTIASPIQNQRFESDSFFSGTVTDDTSVRRMQIFIRNLNTNQYWNGNSFQNNVVLNSAIPQSDGSWAWLTPLPSGRYQVAIRGEDMSGNLSLRTRGAIFDVE